MASLQFKSDGIQKMGQSFARAGKSMKPEKRKRMAQGAALVKNEIQKKIRKPGGGFGPLIAGKSNNLFGDWWPKVWPDGNRAQVTTNKRVYPRVMEKGRRAGAPMPPVKAIEDWIEDKGRRFKLEPIKRKKTVRKKGIKKGAPASIAALRPGKKAKKPKKTVVQKKESLRRQVAFLIARSIKKKGIKGRFYLSQAMVAATPKLSRLFKGLGDAALGRIAQ